MIFFHLQWTYHSKAKVDHSYSHKYSKRTAEYDQTQGMMLHYLYHHRNSALINIVQYRFNASCSIVLFVWNCCKTYHHWPIREYSTAESLGHLAHIFSTKRLALTQTRQFPMGADGTYRCSCTYIYIRTCVACACIDVDVSQDARMREVRMQTSERAFTKSNLNSLINAAPYRQEG